MSAFQLKRQCQGSWTHLLSKKEYAEKQLGLIAINRFMVTK
jgi:hypothetical protein